MGSEEENSEHESDSLVTGSESAGDVHGHYEKRDAGTEKKNDDG